jgi:hypothetical protein
MNTKQILLQLKADIEWMRELLAAQGVNGPWLTPNEAAPILGISRDRIMDEIEAAEYARINRKKSDLIYSEHYFNAQNPHDTKIQRATWKIHFQKFGKVIQLPPEQRILSHRQ